MFKLVCFLLLLASIDVANSSQSFGEEHKPHKTPNILKPDAGPAIDDERYYLRPGITTSELIRARGYIARQYNFITRDNYLMSVVRGTNPLFNNGIRGLDSKLPILFVNAATLAGTSYLANSVGVRPRAHHLEHIDLSQLSVSELKELLDNDPAVKSLPFLAMNLGYEIWMLDRRGYTGPRRKLGRRKRTLADAWNSLPTAMLGNVLDGFTLNANMKPGRPVRTKTHSRNPFTASQNETIHIEAGTAEDQVNKLSESERANRGGRSKRSLLPDILDLSVKSKNILQLMFLLAKLPGAIHRLGDITHDFIDTFDPEFWTFSLDEQVTYDFPAAVDFVVKRTRKRKVHIVGLSCAGAIQLLSLAEQPSLAKKISRAVLWAPSVNMGSKTDIVQGLGRLIPILQSYTGPIPFVFLSKEFEFWLQTICTSELMQRTVCEALLDALGGFSGGQGPVRPFFASVWLAPIGTRELAHLAQFAHTQKPCKYSYNTKEKNLKVYGQEEPPCYDLSRIQLHNISFYVGAFDTLVSPDDIATTELQMRVPSELHIIKGNGIYFNHFGPILHKNNDDLVIIPSLLDMERSQAMERRDKGQRIPSDWENLI